MAASLGHVLAQLQRWTSPCLDECSDAVLLERFVGQRDESAFAALVARHGGIGGTASALAHSVLRTMLVPKLAGAMAVTLTLTLAASATVALVYRGAAAEAPETKAVLMRLARRRENGAPNQAP